MPRNLSLLLLVLIAWPASASAQGTAAAGHMFLGDGGFLLFLMGAPALGSFVLLVALLVGRQWELALKGVAWCVAYFGLVALTDVLHVGIVVLVLFVLAPAFFLAVFVICGIMALRRSKGSAEGA